MDISFKAENEKFNYRACAIIVHEGKILAMQDERSPFYYLPGGRVQLGETAEQAVIREIKEELNVTAKIIRTLWLNQAFFREDVDGLDYHEICVYFLIDISQTDLLAKGGRFVLQEGQHQHTFEWLKYEQLQHEYFYPFFLKRKFLISPRLLHFEQNTNERI